MTTPATPTQPIAAILPDERWFYDTLRENWGGSVDRERMRTAVGSLYYALIHEMDKPAAPAPSPWIACRELLPEIGTTTLVALRPDLEFASGMPCVTAVFTERGTLQRWEERRVGVLQIWPVESVTHWQAIAPWTKPATSPEVGT